jgi:hypothetical protein
VEIEIGNRHLALGVFKKQGINSKMGHGNFQIYWSVKNSRRIDFQKEGSPFIFMSCPKIPRGPRKKDTLPSNFGLGRSQFSLHASLFLLGMSGNTKGHGVP